jgi:hypothetical protein
VVCDPGYMTAPPKGPTIDVSDIGGGALGSPTVPPKGSAIDVSDIGGGRSRISISAS